MQSVHECVCNIDLLNSKCSAFLFMLLHFPMFTFIEWNMYHAWLDITLDISFMFGQADSCFVWRFELNFTILLRNVQVYFIIYYMMADIFIVKLPCGDCQLDSLMTGQNWFQIWFGAVRQQGIIWANADPALCYLPWVNILQWFNWWSSQ